MKRLDLRESVSPAASICFCFRGSFGRPCVGPRPPAGIYTVSSYTRCALAPSRKIRIRIALGAKHQLMLYDWVVPMAMKTNSPRASDSGHRPPRSAASSRVVSSLISGFRATDPLTFAGCRPSSLLAVGILRHGFPRLPGQHASDHSRILRPEGIGRPAKRRPPSTTYTRSHKVGPERKQAATRYGIDGNPRRVFLGATAVSGRRLGRHLRAGHGTHFSVPHYAIGSTDAEQGGALIRAGCHFRFRSRTIFRWRAGHWPGPAGVLDYRFWRPGDVAHGWWPSLAVGFYFGVKSSGSERGTARSDRPGRGSNGPRLGLRKCDLQPKFPMSLNSPAGKPLTRGWAVFFI